MSKRVFSPGPRVSTLDIIVLLIASVATYFLAREIWWLAYVVGFVVAFVMALLVPGIGKENLHAVERTCGDALFEHHLGVGLVHTHLARQRAYRQLGHLL